MVGILFGSRYAGSLNELFFRFGTEAHRGNWPRAFDCQYLERIEATRLLFGLQYARDRKVLRMKFKDLGKSVDLKSSTPASKKYDYTPG